MTPDQIQTIIQALVGLFTAIAAVIAAFKAGGAQQEAKAAKVEAMAARAAAVTPAAPGSLPAGMNIGDIFRYSALIQEILAVVKGVGRMDVGQSTPVPKVVLDLPNGERISFPPTQATRER